MYYKPYLTRDIAIYQRDMLLKYIYASNDLQHIKNQCLHLLAGHKQDA